jgi:hypothetical protein
MKLPTSVVCAIPHFYGLDRGTKAAFPFQKYFCNLFDKNLPHRTSVRADDTQVSASAFAAFHSHKTRRIWSANIINDHRLRPGMLIPFGGELCPVNHCAARIVVNRSYLPHAV